MSDGSEQFTFGKHKGRSFAEILRDHRGYAEWAVKIGDNNCSAGLKRFQAYARENGVNSSESEAARERSPRRDNSSSNGNTTTTAGFRPDLAATLKIQMTYLRHIRSGKKTVEGRVSDWRLNSARAGQHLKLECGKESVFVRIVEVLKFASFAEMLEKVGLEACLPGCSSIADGEKIYHGFPGYEDRARTNGVVAFRVEVEKM